MQMMLRRTHFLNKKKEKKAELEKLRSMIKDMLERILRYCNRKSEASVVELGELTADFSFNADTGSKSD